MERGKRSSSEKPSVADDVEPPGEDSSSFTSSSSESGLETTDSEFVSDSEECEMERLAYTISVRGVEKQCIVQKQRRYPFLRHCQYKTIRTIARSNTAAVHMAAHKRTGHFVAIKIIDLAKLTAAQQKRVVVEYTVMFMLKHMHIIELYEVIHTPVEICMIMEYGAGGDLHDFLCSPKGKRCPKAARLAMFADLVRAVIYMHDQGFIHRDIKLENIMLDSNQNVKLADFGFSSVWAPDHPHNRAVGTLYYASPEVVSGSEYIGPEVDAWSLGVVLFALLTGEFPFYRDTKSETREVIKAGNIEKKGGWRHMSPECRSLITRLLDTDPETRMTPPEILTHPYMLKYVPWAGSPRHKNGRKPSAPTLGQMPARFRDQRSGGPSERSASVINSADKNPVRKATAIEETMPASSASTNFIPKTKLSFKRFGSGKKTKAMLDRRSEMNEMSKEDAEKAGKKEKKEKKGKKEKKSKPSKGKDKPAAKSKGGAGKEREGEKPRSRSNGSKKDKTSSSKSKTSKDKKNAKQQHK